MPAFSRRSGGSQALPAASRPTQQTASLRYRPASVFGITPIETVAKIGCFAGTPDPKFGTAAGRRNGHPIGQIRHIPAHFTKIYPGRLPGHLPRDGAPSAIGPGFKAPGILTNMNSGQEFTAGRPFVGELRGIAQWEDTGRKSPGLQFPLFVGGEPSKFGGTAEGSPPGPGPRDTE